MTESNDPDQIRADIERTRAELSHNVDTLGDTVNPRNIASRQVDKVKDKARTVRDAIMGSPDDPYDHGRAGDLQATVQDGASAVGDAVSNAPSVAKRKTRGNPLAAGLIAFGAGLLVSSLIPCRRALGWILTARRLQALGGSPLNGSRGCVPPRGRVRRSHRPSTEPPPPASVRPHARDARVRDAAARRCRSRLPPPRPTPEHAAH